MAKPVRGGLRPAPRPGSLTSPDPVTAPSGPPRPPPTRTPEQMIMDRPHEEVGGRALTPASTSENSPCTDRTRNDLPELVGGSRLRRLRDLAFPSKVILCEIKPIAARGPGGLIAAHLSRACTNTVRLPQALLAWRRACRPLRRRGVLAPGARAALPTSPRTLGPGRGGRRNQLVDAPDVVAGPPAARRPPAGKRHAPVPRRAA